MCAKMCGLLLQVAIKRVLRMVSGCESVVYSCERIHRTIEIQLLCSGNCEWQLMTSLMVVVSQLTAQLMAAPGWQAGKE